MFRHRWRVLSLPACILPGRSAWRRSPTEDAAVTPASISSSAVGAEGELLAAQLARSARLHPQIRAVQRSTPDAADQRPQLYTQ